MAGHDVRSDLKAHEGSYLRFLSMLKKSGIAAFILAAIVVLIIAR